MDNIVRHAWLWEYTGSNTSAYCICCGIHRKQELYDKSEIGIYNSKYHENGEQLKKAGSCSMNISDTKLNDVLNIINSSRTLREQYNLDIEYVKSELKKPKSKRKFY